MACVCCGFDTVDHQLVTVLQDAAGHFKAFIKVTGGNRCKKHNDALRVDYELSNGKHGAKTAEDSEHIYGRAADFKLYRISDHQQVDPGIVYAYIDSNNIGALGLGLYSNRVHVDTRSGNAARWTA